MEKTEATEHSTTAEDGMASELAPDQAAPEATAEETPRTPAADVAAETRRPEQVLFRVSLFP